MNTYTNIEARVFSLVVDSIIEARSKHYLTQSDAEDAMIRWQDRFAEAGLYESDCPEAGFAFTIEFYEAGQRVKNRTGIDLTDWDYEQLSAFWNGFGRYYMGLLKDKADNLFRLYNHFNDGAKSNEFSRVKRLLEETLERIDLIEDFIFESDQLAFDEYKEFYRDLNASGLNLEGASVRGNQMKERIEAAFKAGKTNVVEYYASKRKIESDQWDLNYRHYTYLCEQGKAAYATN